MSTNSPEGYGEINDDENIFFTPDQMWVCEYLDKWFSDGFKPSSLFKGALAASSKSNKMRNSDWLSQSAHSMREIFYNFGITEKRKSIWKRIIDRFSVGVSIVKNRKEKMMDNVAITQERQKAEEIADLINKLYKIFTNIAHHFRNKKKNKQLIKYLRSDFGLVITDVSEVPDVYDQILEKFIFIIKRTSENILEIHKRIDQLIITGLGHFDKKALEILIHSHVHARDYFFSKAPTEWISWLKENGFFDILNKESKDKSRYTYQMPELRYLLRVVESEDYEEEVLEIINSVDCVNNFNPEVVDQFVQIAQKLSSDSLAKLIPKINEENWVKLMKNFKQSGFIYKEIVQKLLESKSFDGLLLLAKTLLTVDDSIKEDDYSYNYFYLGDIAESGIFEALLNVDEDFIEKGIDLILNVLKKLTYKSDHKKDVTFVYETRISLYDYDLFNPNFNIQRRPGLRDEIEPLLSVLAILIKKKITTDCIKDSRATYDTYITSLPDSQWIWRIKMYSMSHCPKIFLEDIKNQINRIFTAPNYSRLLWGTEYLNVLKSVFPLFEENERRIFVKKVLDKFQKLIKDFPKENWHKRQGWEILSVIASELTEDELKMSEDIFGKALEVGFIPKTHISEVVGGYVKERSPRKFDKYKDISTLIRDLKTELAPEVLKEKYKDDDFQKPRNAEGVGNELRENMKKRMNLYLIHASKFFDSKINIHYTYSFLRGIEEFLREKNKLTNEDWHNLFEMFAKMKEVNRENYAKSLDDEDRWLARWHWVEKTIANILKYFLTQEYGHLFEDKRNSVLELIKKFLASDDPKPEDEVDEYGDLFHIAINSTRGVAFQVLVNFVYRDGELLKDDIFNLYKKTIEKASPSIRFVIGHYLGSFYFRDEERVKELFEIIFPKNEDKRKNFFAAWEGYLANVLYKELFDDLKEYYEYALSLDSSLYPDRRKTRDLDKGIGAHLALAFAHFDNVQYNKDNKHLLLNQLWSSEDTQKQTEFISFLGRGIISNGNAGDEWFKEKNVSLKKLKDFWELILNRDDIDKKVYGAFGTWVNSEKDIFDYSWLVIVIAQSIEKSNGMVDFDHGLVSRLDKFASVDPMNTLVILNKYLLDGILGDSGRNWFYLDEKKIEVFKELYKTKPAETKDLVNKLLEKGGRPFWPLRDILDE